MTKLMSITAITLMLSTAGALARHAHWNPAAHYGTERISPTVDRDGLSSGPYHRDVLRDGTMTGPLPSDAHGG